MFKRITNWKLITPSYLEAWCLSIFRTALWLIILIVTIFVLWHTQSEESIIVRPRVKIAYRNPWYDKMAVNGQEHPIQSLFKTFNRNLKKMVRRKARLYRPAKTSNQWTSFKTYQKHCKKSFKKAEINHINDVIQKGLDEINSKPFWRYVKSRRQDSVGVPPLKKMEQLFNASKEKAQIMVEQFPSVFTRNSDNHLPDTRKRARRSIPELHITVDGVQKLFLGINTSKAQRPDQIANIMLKNCAPS